MATMSYPEKFHAAVKAAGVPSTASALSGETRLILYALQSQAQSGPCALRSKWGMSGEERAKYETWVNLGKMDAFEAMRLFVKLLDEEKPGWWKTGRTDGASSETSGAGGGSIEDSKEDVGKNAGRFASLRRGEWMHMTSDSSRGSGKPLPRYRHACCVSGDEMFVIGGSVRGRNTNDFSAYDAGKNAWRTVKTVHLRPCAGMQAVVHDGVPYLVGGNVEVQTAVRENFEPADEAEEEETAAAASAAAAVSFLNVSRIDFSEDAAVATFSPVPTTTPNGDGDGDGEDHKSARPSFRVGHTATVCGDDLVVFGGQDARGTFLNDARALNMKTFEWRVLYENDGGGFFSGLFNLTARVKDPNAPRPRAEHVAVSLFLRNDGAFVESNGLGRFEPFDSSSGAEANAEPPRATVLILGGACASNACFDDAHALDVRSGAWTALRMRGNAPGPRAGHACCVFRNRYLCVAGGGDGGAERVSSASAFSRAAVLDLRRMTWLDRDTETFASFPGTGEGMSLVCFESAPVVPKSRGFVKADGVFVAFGGYDGSRYGETRAFRFPESFSERFPSERPGDVPASPGGVPVSRGGPPGRGGGDVPGTSETAREASPPNGGPLRFLFGRRPDSEAEGRLEKESRADAERGEETPRLRRENAQLREDARRAVQTQAALRARAEAAEARRDSLERSLLETRALVRKLELEASLEKAAPGEGARLEGEARRDADERKHPRQSTEGKEGKEEDEDEDEDEAPSPRGWFFGL